MHPIQYNGPERRKNAIDAVLLYVMYTHIMAFTDMVIRRQKNRNNFQEIEKPKKKTQEREKQIQ